MRFSFFLCIVLIFKLSSQTQPYLINGVFEHKQNKYIENGNIKSNGSVKAYFSNTAISTINFNELNRLDWIKYNNINLKWLGEETRVYSRYEKVISNENHNDEDEMDEVCNTIAFTTKNWTIKGNRDIPDMNFIYSGIIPQFDVGVNILKDTLNKNDTLFVSLSNLTHADSLSFSFYDNTDLNDKNRGLCKMPNYTSTYYIPPSVFTNLRSGYTGYIVIEAWNQNYQIIQNKTYLFKNMFSFTKPKVYIKN